MAYPITSIDKRLSLTPVSQGVSPTAKDKVGEVEVIGKLSKYITVPSIFLNEFFALLPDFLPWYRYAGQLLFSFNVEFTENFYLLNVNRLRAFANDFLCGGALVVKWRVGSVVYRYKLLDHNESANWLVTIPQYNRQKIGKNFSFEFYGNTKLPSEIIERGIIQPITFHISTLYKPSAIDEQSSNLQLSKTTFTSGGYLGNSPALALIDSVGTVPTLPSELPWTHTFMYFQNNVM